MVVVGPKHANLIKCRLHRIFFTFFIMRLGAFRYQQLLILLVFRFYQISDALFWYYELFKQVECLVTVLASVVVQVPVEIVIHRAQPLLKGIHRQI